MNKLMALAAFCQVVDEGGFSAAARKLDVSPAMVSKYINQLEEELQVRLLTRTTRSVRLTEAGARYHQVIAPLLLEMGAADQQISQHVSAPRGELRLTSPMDLGEKLLPGVISKFQQVYPDVAVSLDLTDRQVDLFNENYDLAIRAGRILAPELVARKLMTMELVVCAAPAYLDAAGVPNHPKELTSHNCLINSSTADLGFWQFVDPLRGDPLVIRVHSNLRINHARSLMAAALNGVGILYVPRMLVDEALRLGQLVPLLERFALSSVDVFAVYPERQFLPAKTRCFIDFLVDSLPT